MVKIDDDGSFSYGALVYGIRVPPYKHKEAHELLKAKKLIICRQFVGVASSHTIVPDDGVIPMEKLDCFSLDQRNHLDKQIKDVISDPDLSEDFRSWFAAQKPEKFLVWMVG